ncbi:MAG: hypothetical protein WCO58_03140 [bacterium]
MKIFIFTEDFTLKPGYIHCTPVDWNQKQLKLFFKKPYTKKDVVIHKKNARVSRKKDIIILDSPHHDFTAKALRFAEETEIPLLIIKHNNDAHFPKVQEYPIIFKKESDLDEESIFDLIHSVKDKLPRGTDRYFTKFFSVEELEKYRPKKTTQQLFQ